MGQSRCSTSPFHGKGLPATRRPVQDNGRRKLYPEQLVMLLVHNDVDDMFIEECFKDFPTRQAKLPTETLLVLTLCPKLVGNLCP